MKEVLRSQIIASDNGGEFSLSKKGSVFTHDNKKYTYIASGLVRDVYVSEDRKTVIKVPKVKSYWGFDHNRLEVEAYNEAPEWCKKHIAVSTLTDDGYVIQEYLNVNPDCGAFFRELGKRENGDIVIFDCDILLSSDYRKPDEGFRYQYVFSLGKFFKDAHLEAIEIPKRAARAAREQREKYFPNLHNQKCVTTSDGENGSVVYIDDEVVPHDIAVLCGFI